MLCFAEFLYGFYSTDKITTFLPFDKKIGLKSITFNPSKRVYVSVPAFSAMWRGCFSIAILLIGHLDMEARKKACQGSLARLGAYDRNISSFSGKG